MSTILITGTSTGIGYTTAIAAGRAGYSVIATMRNPQKATQLKEVATQENLPITIIPLDVDSDNSVVSAFEEVFERFETLDVLINNAGIGWWGAIEDTPVSEYKQMMETNFFGVIRCIKAVLPHMRKKRNGRIINISSVAGRLSGGAQSAYCSSKWALEAMSESLAQEVCAYDIQVNLVEPGIIKTPIIDKLDKQRTGSAYPHEERLNRLFNAVMKNPVHPDIVAEKIIEIIESNNYQLRHPVGPDALPYIEWRSSVSDEEWVERGAQTNEEWETMIRDGFGIPV
ncbi:MAG: SDR family oxidoreductase [Melioribacteraceae bacterium]|nr:SDR family oxidoreductase [Melioribacteraceae bacterium]